MSNNILKMFLKQSGIDPAHINQPKIHEETVEKIEKREDLAFQSRLWSERSAAGMSGIDLKRNLDIPTQNPDISQKTESHPKFKGYDHSLEQRRWQGTGGSDPIEMEEV